MQAPAVLARPPWIGPIPGTRRLSRLRENAAATEVGLSTDERAELDALATRVGVAGDYGAAHMQAGDRYGAAHLKMVGR